MGKYLILSYLSKCSKLQAYLPAGASDQNVILARLFRETAT